MGERRLLLIDDEPEFGKLVKHVAENLGFEVMVTQHAQDFKDGYESFRPEVIILDIVMPETDGIELMNWLVQQGSNARVICVSGYHPDYAKMAETLGTLRGGMSVTSLVKPIRLAELRSALS